MTDFWSILFGVTAFFALIALYAEYTDRRDHARYRRRQQDRVNRRVGYIHNGDIL